MPGLPHGATLEAHQMHMVWAVFFWTAVFVAAVVYGLIAWCIIRYRDRGDGRPVGTFHNNAPLELTWTAIPLLIVTGLFILTNGIERHVETLVDNPALVVNVTGFRWSWRFDYPQSGTSIVGTLDHPPELVLPVDRIVRFNVTSSDVDHSFWVPAFLFKRDAIPGLQNEFEWTPSRLGTFRGECGEFCGLDHALMSFKVSVVSGQDFDAWVSRQRGTATAKRPGGFPG